ncbi:MAG: hypothetical protein ABJC12_07290, partial [Saprospiraceae bacterium]
GKTTPCLFFYEFILDTTDYTILIYFDIPIYWYDNSTRELGKSWLNKGCEISFNSIKAEFGAISVSIRDKYQLFSEYLSSISSRGTIEPSAYYFEPAARMNSLILRNNSLEMKVKYPDSRVEFDSQVKNLPVDDFGFTGIKSIL